MVKVVVQRVGNSLLQGLLVLRAPARTSLMLRLFRRAGNSLLQGLLLLRAPARTSLMLKLFHRALGSLAFCRIQPPRDRIQDLPQGSIRHQHRCLGNCRCQPNTPDVTYWFICFLNCLHMSCATYEKSLFPLCKFGKCDKSWYKVFMAPC